jgi:hypothetical protein
MLIESNGEKEKCLQYSEFQGRAHLSPLLPHEQLGYSRDGFESSDHLCIFSFFPLEKPMAHSY